MPARKAAATASQTLARIAPSPNSAQIGVRPLLNRRKATALGRGANFQDYTTLDRSYRPNKVEPRPSLQPKPDITTTFWTP